MKYIFTLILSTYAFFSQAQYKGYSQIGLSVFANDKWENKAGLSASGGGSINKFICIGAGVDVYEFNSNSDNGFTLLYLNLRLLYPGLNRKSSGYIDIQPGWNLYNSGTTKGNYSLNALAGFFLRGKKRFGAYISAGTSYITTKDGNVKNGFLGFKLTTGFMM